VGNLGVHGVEVHGVEVHGVEVHGVEVHGVEAHGVEVRSAGPADLDEVVACQTLCWREAYAGLVADSYLDDPLAVQRRRQRWTANLDGGREVWVADRAGRVVGVASSGPNRDNRNDARLELMSLYLRADVHGSGVADRMIGDALGGSPALLWVFAANSRAQSFYRRHGFVADGLDKLDPDTGLMEIRMARTAR
jgi:GNAT superfamily N-acetyltransferase